MTKQFYQEARKENRILLPGDPGFEEVLKGAREYKQLEQKVSSDELPRVRLQSMSNTMVITETEEEYDSLMQIYEAGRWTGTARELPTDTNLWLFWKDATRVNTDPGAEGIFDIFEYDPESMKNYKMILPEEFYDISQVNGEKRSEIYNWFDIHRPQRRSRPEEDDGWDGIPF